MPIMRDTAMNHGGVFYIVGAVSHRTFLNL